MVDFHGLHCFDIPSDERDAFVGNSYTSREQGSKGICGRSCEKEDLKYDVKCSRYSSCIYRKDSVKEEQGRDRCSGVLLSRRVVMTVNRKPLNYENFKL